MLLFGAALVARSSQAVKMMCMYYTGALQNQHLGGRHLNSETHLYAISAHKQRSAHPVLILTIQNIAGGPHMPHSDVVKIGRRYQLGSCCRRNLRNGPSNLAHASITFDILPREEPFSSAAGAAAGKVQGKKPANGKETVSVILVIKRLWWPANAGGIAARQS